MTLKMSVPVGNARLDAIETQVGASPMLQLRSGAAPANCAAANSGSLIAQLPLPADWMNSAAAASKTLKGTWTVAAILAGTIGHFRIFDNGLTTCGLQGTVSLSGGGGDMIADAVAVVVGQACTVTVFTINDANQ